MTTTDVASPPATEPPEGPAQPVPSAGSAALAGLVAAGAALAFGELPSAIAGKSVSLITAVGNEFVDRYAASLKEVAIALFGTNDKTALIIGITATSLLLGAVLGVVGRRRFGVAVGGFFAFGVVGAAAALTDPQAGGASAVVGPLLAIVAGVATLRWLLAKAPIVARPAAPPTSPPPVGDPRVHTPDRRAFLGWSATIGAAAAVVGAGGRSLRNRGVIDEQRSALTLPEPTSSVAVPPTTGVEVDGISPYVTPNGEFYKIDTALISPRVNADTWTLKVHGLVDRPFELDFAELLSMDMVEAPVTIACVSNEVGDRLVGNAVWRGVPLERILERAGVQPEGTQIVGRSVDDFTVGFPTAVLDGRTALVAVGMNGEPLPVDHGYPARLIVAGLYGYVSATKWLSEIELTRFEDFDAYWVPRGWAKQAPIKLQSRIDVPRRSTPLVAGPVPVAGVAWDPNIGVAGVEVRVDDGDWQPARLGLTANDDTWVQWVYDWPATTGRHRLQVRALSKDGEVQTGDLAPPRPDGATGWHTREVTVA